jgi:hypothetical protein
MAGNATVTTATSYRERGWSPIPLKIRSKEPKLSKGHPFLSRKATDEEFARFDFRHNVGIVTGKVSGVIVLDDDDGGATLKENGWNIPATPTVRTKRGHQYFFRCPDEGFPTFDVSEKLEVRGDGAYVVAPPSVHPSGHVYEWVISPDDAELANLPGWLIEQAKRRGRRPRAEDVGEEIRDGSRNKTLTSVAGSLRRRGLDEASIYAALLGINAEKCKPPLPEDEVLKIARSVSRYEPGSEPPYDSDSEPASENGGAKTVNPLLAGRVLLREAMERGIEPPGELEPGVLLRGKVHQIFSAAGLGKTMLALWLVKRCIDRSQVVVYFDDENGPRTISERLQDMGADPARVDEHLYYLPFPSLPMTQEAKRNYVALLEELRPDLVVFDSWINFLAGAGLNENENTDIQVWCTAYTKEARDRGITVALLDHVPHEGSRARGASRKKDEADVQWQLYRTKHYSRDSVGEVVLHREKDRDDWLDASVKFSVGGTKDGRLIFERSAGTVEEPDPTDGLTESARTLLRVLRLKFAITGATASEWAEAAGVSRQTVYRNRDSLIDRGLARLERNRYYPTDGGPTDGGDESVTPPSDPQDYDVTPNVTPDGGGVTFNQGFSVTPEDGLFTRDSDEVSHGVTRCNTGPDVTDAGSVTPCNTPLKGVTRVTPARTSAPITVESGQDDERSDQGDRKPAADQDDHGVRGDHDHDHLARHSLTPEQVVAEIGRPGSGPARALAHYLETHGSQRLEYLVKAVLRARGLPTASWEAYEDVVLAAVIEHEREAGT